MRKLYSSIFAERLNDSMTDRDLSASTLANDVSVQELSILRYLRYDRVPEVAILIQLANRLNVTTDYLLGLEPENNSLVFRQCPPFSEQLFFLLQHFGFSKYRLRKVTGFHDASIYAWLKGTHLPSTENIVKLADCFDCSVDFVLGR